MTNYQYRYGGTAIDVVRALYAEGGPRRFYRGHWDPLSLSFFVTKTALSCSFHLISTLGYARIAMSCLSCIVMQPI